jgi:hypothetical protein
LNNIYNKLNYFLTIVNGGGRSILFLGFFIGLGSSFIDIVESLIVEENDGVLKFCLLILFI